MTIFGYTCKIAVLVMTEIVLAHDQKHVPGHDFSVRPNASPKRTLDGSIIAYILSPLHIHNSLLVNDLGCIHPGIFPSDIM